MDARTAARRWARTWALAWPRRDADEIASLYAPDAIYRSHPMRDPVPGGALAYARREFANEADIVCRFGEPIAGGERAAVEWWASWTEDDRTVTIAGVTILRFDDRGLVVEHVDIWNEGDGRVAPFAGWER